MDLKYGKGVKGGCKKKCTRDDIWICCLETFGNLYDIDEVRLCIYQPRLSSESEWNITVKDLYKWADEVLMPGIEKIKNGSEEFHTSKHCVFCKAKPLCKALKDMNLELSKHEFRHPFLMDDDEIEEVLDLKRLFGLCTKNIPLLYSRFVIVIELYKTLKK